MFEALYKSGIIGDNIILYGLLLKPEPVTYRKKICGYGLSEMEFDKQDNCSRRVFNYRKEKFLKKRWIIKLKKRGKKQEYYSITPLGISYLCEISNGFDTIPAKRILNFLSLFYKNEKKLVRRTDLPTGIGLPVRDINLAYKSGSNVIGSISKIVGDKTLMSSLNSSFKCIRTDYGEKNYETIYFTYPIFNEGVCNVRKFVITDDKIMEFYHKTEEITNLMIQNITDDRFHYYLSEFILQAFQFSLVKEITNHMDSAGFHSEKKNTKKIKEEQNKIDGLKRYEPDIMEQAVLFGNNLKKLLDLSNDNLSIVK